MPFLKHESTLGSGISGHLSEYQDFEKVNYLIKRNEEIEDKKNIIAFFDEVFNTSNHNDIYNQVIDIYKQINNNNNDIYNETMNLNDTYFRMPDNV